MKQDTVEHLVIGVMSGVIAYWIVNTFLSPTFIEAPAYAIEPDTHRW
jgi:hypothetical protein